MPNKSFVKNAQNFYKKTFENFKTFRKFFRCSFHQQWRCYPSRKGKQTGWSHVVLSCVIHTVYKSV